jgi:hypothetical protein
MQRVEYCAKLVQTFCPLTIQSSSRGVARVDSDARSLPRSGFGKALTPLLATAEKPRHHFCGESGRRVIDHRGSEHLDHRVRTRFGETAADYLLANDRAKHRGATQSAGCLRPPVPHPAGVVKRSVHSGELSHMAFKRSIRPGAQVVIVEPGAQVGPELRDIHA